MRAAGLAGLRGSTPAAGYLYQSVYQWPARRTKAALPLRRRSGPGHRRERICR